MPASGAGSLQTLASPGEPPGATEPSLASGPIDDPAGREEPARRAARYGALAAAGSALWTAHPDGHFVEPQPAWESYTGQGWPEQRGAGWINAVHTEDREAVRLAWVEARECGRAFDVEPRVWHAGHRSHRHCLLRAAPVPGPDGAVLEWVGTLTDVEEQRIAQHGRRVAETLEAVGRLAGGVAHEANNQMMVVLSSVDFLRRRLLDDGGREELEYIRRAAQRTAAIAQQLLAFSRKQILRPSTVQLNEFLRAREPALQAALGKSVQIVLRLAPGMGPVKADPGQLQQALLNLAFNARDAMDRDGVLTIETAEVVIDQSSRTGDRPQVMGPGRYAMLVVSDTGRGMDQATLSHAFEPFFTTKDVGEGTGLGLSAVYGMVKQSGGFFWAQSAPGKGAAFTIYLPVVGPSSGPAATSEAPAGPAAKDVILLAEDDEMVRIIFARTLRDAGYAILEARDGVEALEVASTATVPPSLVIADVMMPRVNGQRLWSEVRARWPDLPLLFVSGAASLDSVSQSLVESGHELLQKPIEPEVLVRKVRTLLAARRR